MADERAFGAELVTPESPLFAGDAIAVYTKTSEGDLAVLKGHTQLVGDVVSGITRIERPDGTIEAFCVHRGFLQVDTAVGAAVGLVEGIAATERSTRVTLLAGVAEPVSMIDVARAQAAKEAATAALSALSSRDDEEAAIERGQLERALERAELRLGAQDTAGALAV